MKPSDFPRDERFRTPGDPFIEHGVAHLRSYRDVSRVMLDGDCEEFSQDITFLNLAPQDIPRVSRDTVGGSARLRADGSVGRHDVLRSVIEPAFRARPVKGVPPIVGAHVDALVRSIVQKGTGEFNLATEFAYPLALRTICTFAGLPLVREEWLLEETEIARQSVDLDHIPVESSEAEEFVWDVLRSRTAHPGDELLDRMIDACRAGTITEAELFSNVWALYHFGTSDPGTNIANALSLLAEFQLLDDARDHLDDPEWIGCAGEEILRFGTPFPAQPTTTVKDVTLADGLLIPARTPVKVWFSAANRDDAVNSGDAAASSPNVFDVTRSPNKHVAFGFGVYRCFGAHMARVLTQVALPAVLRALPGLDLDTSQPFVRYAGLDDGVTQAPFRFEQQAAERLLAA